MKSFRRALEVAVPGVALQIDVSGNCFHDWGDGIIEVPGGTVVHGVGLDGADFSGADLVFLGSGRSHVDNVTVYRLRADGGSLQAERVLAYLGFHVRNTALDIQNSTFRDDCGVAYDNDAADPEFRMTDSVVFSGEVSVSCNGGGHCEVDLERNTIDNLSGFTALSLGTFGPGAKMTAILRDNDLFVEEGNPPLTITGRVKLLP